MVNNSSTTAFIVVLLLYFLAAKAVATSICKTLVEAQGYICQQHTVVTEDGYILGVQRIPMRRFANKTANNNNPPVLLQHGLFADAATWLLGSPNEALGFILADNGFDVWLSNTRGTNSSRGHTSLSPRDPAYWEWSWDELVDYELPALFQYVQDHTGQTLHYVGHSLGTLTAMGAFSQGKLINILRSAAFLCPVAYLGQISSPIPRITAELFLSEKLYLLNVREFIPNGHDVVELLDFVCKTLGINGCLNLALDILTGPNCCLKTSTENDLDKYVPQSTATKNIIHLCQMIRSGNIAKYDYGNEDDNVKHYGQPTPPVYNIKSIPKTVPLFLDYGGKDTLSDVNDVQLLLDDLKYHDADKLVANYREDYAHVDFILAANANLLVYDGLIDFFTHF